jgi:energy-coupling factor transport system substrate-specific component
MPLMLTLLLGLCLAVLLYESQGQTINTKLIALLGVLVAINAALRFIEVAIPGPGGFSPIFFLIILTGYIYGSRFGFLMGSLTMFVSALVTGGVGPWLPSQMFAAGWAGMSATLCRPIVHILNLEDRRGEVVLLALFGIWWGFMYGFIMNLWSWPFIAGPAEQYWTPGAGFTEILRRYLTYYAVTSLGWDILRAIGNALLIMSFGLPTLRALRRFQRRFDFDYQPNPAKQINPELNT